ncbi:DUF4179 domain-containing protein [Clostridium bovifaecis]|uniref:DUF4179 domain-containing protein n=1 Tax=Clostridium bovifaecis TaxID=2184719 RepID=A0A6I6EQN6_9CLOT|nr:DUF4179 domain-containing protein [Clostridium bovifaecis]
MSKVEDMFNSKKIEIEELKIPDKLEERLRGALQNANPKRKEKSRLTVKIASLVIAVLLIGYNSDTLAFYGKKLIGFDEVMTDTLKGLNELGKGQVIDKIYNFKNGVKVTLDGVMMDDNQLLMFYTIESEKGNIDELDIAPMGYIQGILGKHYMKGGQGIRNGEGTEIKWQMEFEKPHFFEKSFKWNVTLKNGNEVENGEIAFQLDRSKAMGHTLKKKMNKSIKIDQGEVSFESIVASPTTTYIKGKIQNIFELAKDELSGEGFRPTDLDIRLIANGKEVQLQSGGISTNLDGITFDKKFDALPKDLKTLQIKVASLQTNNKVDEKIDLSKGEKGKSVEILGQKIDINDVYEKEGKTHVTITTKEDVLLSKVYMMMEDKKVELKSTVPVNHDKKQDGTITYTRTLCFEDTGDKLTLAIRNIRYNKTYNKEINVEVQ